MRDTLSALRLPAIHQLLSHVPASLLKILPARLARRCAFEHPGTALRAPDGPRQLLVDVSVIHRSDAGTGIQRVVRSLWLQLMQSPPMGYSVCPVFATRQHGYRYASHDFLTAQAQPPGAGNTQVQAHSGDIFLGLDLAAHLLPLHQAEILRWKRSGVKLHVVVYDLLPLQHPEWFNPKTTRHFERWVRCVAVYADHVVCISETVKQDLLAWLGASFGLLPSTVRASSIVLGADIEASAPSGGLPHDAETLIARLRSTPSVLMVGTLEPRKGYDQALAAFEELWQQPGPEPLLVLVGRPGWKTEALQKKLRTHAEAGQRLFWLDDASDEYLANLYAVCSGVLVASRAEGFGLPIVEAALHGKPVLARDLPVFREIPVKGVTYFDSQTPRGLAAALMLWLKSTAYIPTRPAAQTLPTWQLAATRLVQTLGLEPAYSLPDAIGPSTPHCFGAVA